MSVDFRYVNRHRVETADWTVSCRFDSAFHVFLYLNYVLS